MPTVHEVIVGFEVGQPRGVEAGGSASEETCDWHICGASDHRQKSVQHLRMTDEGECLLFPLFLRIHKERVRDGLQAVGEGESLEDGLAVDVVPDLG